MARETSENSKEIWAALFVWELVPVLMVLSTNRFGVFVGGATSLWGWKIWVTGLFLGVGSCSAGFEQQTFVWVT